MQKLCAFSGSSLLKAGRFADSHPYLTFQLLDKYAEVHGGAACP